MVWGRVRCYGGGWGLDWGWGWGWGSKEKKTRIKYLNNVSLPALINKCQEKAR